MKVSFVPAGGGSAIDADVANDGTYTIELAAGDYDVDASRPGYEAVAVAAFGVVDGNANVLGATVFPHNINIGVAVDTERGLLAPVVRDADKKSIISLDTEICA